MLPRTRGMHFHKLSGQTDPRGPDSPTLSHSLHQFSTFDTCFSGFRHLFQQPQSYLGPQACASGALGGEGFALPPPDPPPPEVLEGLRPSNSPKLKSQPRNPVGIPIGISSEIPIGIHMGIPMGISRLGFHFYGV